MPDDDLGIDPSEPTQTGSGEESASGGDPTSTAGLTTDQLQAVLSEALATGNQPVLEAVQQLGAALANTPGSTTANSEAATPVAGASTDLAERLLTDPDSVLNEKMNEWAKANLAAPLGRTFEADRDERIEARAAEIDLELGDGYFDSNIRDRLTGPKGNLLTFPIHEQANPKVIDAAINAILGNDYRDPERRANMQEALAATAKAKEERNVAAAPNMMGPGRSAAPRSDKLTPDLQEALAGFQKVGVTIDEKALKSALGRDNTLEGWRKQQAALKGAA